MFVTQFDLAVWCVCMQSASMAFWTAFRDDFDDKDRHKVSNSVISSLIVSPMVTVAYVE